MEPICQLGTPGTRDTVVLAELARMGSSRTSIPLSICVMERKLDPNSISGNV